MTAAADRIQQMLDDSEIRALIHRYFGGLDALDKEALNGCFAADVEVRYHIGTPGEVTQCGRDTVVHRLTDPARGLGIRTHVCANIDIRFVDGDAHVVTNGVANVTTGPRVLVRGLRYVDLMSRIDGTWQIVRREHQALWQYEAGLTELTYPKPARMVTTDVGPAGHDAGSLSQRL